MRRFATVPFVTLALLALGASAVSCNDGGGGGGGGLKLEEYFDELEGASTDLDERTASLVETLETSGDLEELKEAASQYPDILGDFIEDLEAQEGPSEAADAHQDAIDAGRTFLDVLSGVVDEAEQAETVDEFVSALASDEVETASDAFTRTCLALQAMADDNEIDVDLGCGA
jgi:hypothetical protein